MKITKTTKTTNKLKAALSLIAALAVSLAVLSSCGVSLTREEVIEVVAPLIEKSFAVNEIFFGKGLPHEGDESFDSYDPEEDDNVKYDVKPVKYLIVSSEEFRTLDDLRAVAREVYTDAYLENVFKIAFEGMTRSDGTIYQYPRYISNVIGGLSVDSEAENENKLANRTYDLSTLEITGGGKNRIYFTVKSYVDGVEDVDVALSIMDEGAGWRLDSPTY